MAGKREAFTPEENEVLRTDLVAYRKAKNLSQAELGTRIGISQQNVGRFEREEGGLGRQTANQLAVLLGFRDAEDLLLARGVLAEMKAAPQAGAAWTRRDHAMRYAASLHLDHAAVQAVVSRYTDDTSRTRPEKWWVGKFIDEDRERLADRAIPASPKSQPRQEAQAERAPRKRRHG